MPFVTGSIGLLGTKPSWDLMKGCDTFLMVGSAFPYSEFLPKPGDARGVQIDIDGSRLSLRYPMEVNMVGDSATTLRALLPMLTQKKESSWRRGIEKGLRSWWQTLEERAMDSAEPLNPQRVFWELSPRLPDNAIITADFGSVANWYARDLKMRRGMKASLSGGLASLGAGTPYAVAGKMAFPDRTVIACMGDGAMQMNGLNVMITISKYWKQWSNPRLIVLVLNNRDLNQVTWEERIQLGAGKTEVHPEHSGFPLSQIRGTDRAQGHLRRQPGPGRRRLGRGAGRRSAGHPRSLYRSQRAAAAAAHHAEGCQELRQHDSFRA